MKKSHISFCVLILLSIFVNQGLQSQNNKDVLVLSGEFTSYGSPLEGVIVKVFLDSANVETIMANRSGKFKLFLDYKNVYELEFSKKGYITQKIEFSTKLPNAVYKRDAASFFLTEEFEMYQDFPGIDASLFNNYFIRYKWDNDKYYFIKNESHDKKIKKEQKLGELLQAQDKVRGEIYKNYIKDADAAMAGNNFQEAGYLYALAEDLKPKEKYAPSQIKEVKKKMKETGILDNGYDEAIAEGDLLMAQKKYEEAKKAYRNALFIKNKESYPIERISFIDSLFSNEYLQSVNLYDAAIERGIQYEKNGDLKKAEAEYVSAGKVLPDDKIYKNKLSEVRRRLEIQDQQSVREEVTKQQPISNTSDNAVKGSEENITEKAIQEKPLSVKEDLIENKEKATSITVSSNKETPQVENPKKDETVLNVENNEDITVNDIAVTPEGTSEALENKSNVIADTSVMEDNTMLLMQIMEKLKESRALKNKKEESNNLENIGNIFHAEENFSKAIEYYKMSIQILEEEGDLNKASNVMGEVAMAYLDSGLFENSVNQYKKAIEIKNNIGDKEGASEFLNDLGIIHETAYEYDEALDYYEKSLELKREVQDTVGELQTLNNIADVYFQQNELEKSLDYYKQTLDVSKAIKDEENEGTLMNDIGVTLYELGRYDEAIDYYEKAVKIKEKTNNQKEVSMALNNIGNVKFDWSDYNNAINYYEKSIALKEEIEYWGGIAISLYNIANSYERLGNFAKAIDYYLRSEKEAEKSNASRKVMSDITSSISRIYGILGQYKQAYDYQNKYIDIGIFGQLKNRVISEKRDRFEDRESKKEIKFLKRKIQRQKILADREAMEKQREIAIKNLELRNNATELKKQRIISYFLASVGILVIIIALFIFKLLRNNRRSNKKLQEKNNLILTQSNHIKDSITYASKIQKAAMPQTELMDKLLGDYFVFNKPLDIVSGDFYWLSEVDGKIVLAVADCTGHGVPGAMMCMLGVSFLDEIVKGKKIVQSNEILEAMRGQVMELLHQKGDLFEQSDGIDMALCVFEKNMKTVYYSGANNSLYLIRNGELIEHKANRMPVSFSYKTDKFSYTKVELQKEDMIYLFSDGYMDQLGGPRNTRMMRRRFQSTLLSIAGESIERQKEILEEKLLEWMGETSTQVDDILILGIRI